MDVVFILRDNFNRFLIENSVALVKKNLKPDKIFIVGGNPEIEGTTHILCPDINTENIEANITRKFLTACFTEEISDPFIEMDDDMFIIKPMNINEIPLWHKYHLIPTKKTSLYNKRIVNTGETCLKLDIDGYNYECHLPIPVYKKQFIDAMSLINWDNEGIGICCRSIYANRLNRGKKSPYPYGDAKSLLNDIDLNDPADIENKLKDINIISMGRKRTKALKSFILKLNENR